jgi:CheY-specific phosphatase CheX
MSFSRKQFPKAMAAIHKRTSAYLRDEIGLEVSTKTMAIGNIDVLELRDTTIIVGTGGPVSLLIAFCFDRTLLDHLFQKATASLDIASHEESLFMRETAAETVNFIIGHATADLAIDGNDVTLSPPVVLEGGRRIHRPKKAMFATLELSTNYGILDVFFVGPPELFDQKLNILSDEGGSCSR